uniref:Variant surface glycoprotein 1125.5632 n=1 Tax=Trypanosoma brucei TaxID=5691 RepID=A0A1J0RD85_9TRYP|nr:variant surface glycoprotein 1125.5632 [Trypanosoma brucei]
MCYFTTVAALMLAMLLHNQQHAAAENAKALKAEAANHICAINTELKKAPGHVGQQVKILAQLAEKLLTIRKQLSTIYGGTNTTNCKEKEMLEPYFRKKAKEALSTISSAGAKAVSEAAASAWRAGRIDEFMYTFHQVNTSSSNGYCIKGTNNSAAKNELACIDDTTGKPTPPPAGPQEKTEPTKKQAAFHSGSSSDKQADGTDTKCGLTMHDSTDGGYTRNQEMTTPVKWAGGLFKTGGEATPTYHTSASGDFTATELALCTDKLTTLTTQ